MSNRPSLRVRLLTMLLAGVALAVVPLPNPDATDLSALARGGGGGGGQQSGVGALSEQQRQIISATFNVERDKAKTPADKFREDTVFLGLSQARLREEVETIRQQMLDEGEPIRELL